MDYVVGEYSLVLGLGLLVFDVGSIQVYYVSVFCYNNYCFCYFFLNKNIFILFNFEFLEYYSCFGSWLYFVGYLIFCC